MRERKTDREKESLRERKRDMGKCRCVSETRKILVAVVGDVLCCVGVSKCEYEPFVHAYSRGQRTRTY
jgi:hypothetical protein